MFWGKKICPRIAILVFFALNPPSQPVSTKEDSNVALHGLPPQPLIYQTRPTNTSKYFYFFNKALTLFSISPGLLLIFKNSSWAIINLERKMKTGPTSLLACGYKHGHSLQVSIPCPLGWRWGHCNHTSKNILIAFLRFPCIFFPYKARVWFLHFIIEKSPLGGGALELVPEGQRSTVLQCSSWSLAPSLSFPRLPKPLPVGSAGSAAPIAVFLCTAQPPWGL